MHEAGTDCLLVRDGDRLVGIFTDRDAVVKVAGKGVDRVRGPRVHDARSRSCSGPTTRLAVAIHKMAVGELPARPGRRRRRPADRRWSSAADVFRHIVNALG